MVRSVVEDEEVGSEVRQALKEKKMYQLTLNYSILLVASIKFFFSILSIVRRVARSSLKVINTLIVGLKYAE